MDDSEFDRALIAAALELAGDKGWRHASVAAAARAGGLDLARARERFAGRGAILLRLGRLADQAALASVPADGSVKDRLFDLLMHRIDVLQAHRAGVLALFRALPSEPPTALLLACATRRSMRWMLDAVGVSAHGVRGELRVKGLGLVWLWAMRAWQADESTDLSATMAALDAALARAEQAAGMLGWRGRAATEEPAVEEPPDDGAPVPPL